MDQTLYQIVVETLENNQKHFESIYKHDQTWNHFDYPVELLLECIEIENLSEKEEQYCLLALGVLSDLFSCLVLIRQGYIRPPAVVLRASIENICMLVAIHKDEATYKKFAENKLNNTKDCVPKAKPEFQYLVRMWGILSEKFVHETVESIGRVVGVKGLNVIPDFKNHIGTKLKQEEIILLMLPTILDELATALEWVFYRKLKKLKKFEFVETDILKKIHDPKILELLSKFEEKLKGL